MTQPIKRVIKVGGSLFDFSDLVPSLRNWLATQAKSRNVLIAGGGQLVETIRRADQLHFLGEVASHELCIRAMAVTARMLAALLPDARLTDRLEIVDAVDASTIIVFDVERFMRDDDPNSGGTPLPQNWDVTSDSIAGRIAEVIGADELVLMKSSTVSLDLAEAAKAGQVDAYFPKIAVRLPSVRCVNLRAPRVAVGNDGY